MPLPRFTKTGMTTLIFSRGNTFPDSGPPAFRQRVLRSYAGTTRTATYSDPDTLLPFQFDQLPLADALLVDAWFRHALINGSAETFTYTDAASVAHEVRLEPGTLSITPIAYQLYRVSMGLREEPS